MKFKLYLFVILSIFSSKLIAQSPTFEEVLSLKSISSPSISPNGKHVVYQVQTTDWDENRYDRELWIAKDGNTPFQLTNNLEGNSTSAQWSPNGKWIAFLSKRKEKTQIQVIRASGGEAMQLTSTEQNISSFQWAPDGKSIAFLQSEDKSKENKKRKDAYGAFSVEDEEYSLMQLWQVSFDEVKLAFSPTPAQMKDSTFKEESAAKELLASDDFTITNFMWSPDGTKIVFNHQPNPLINSFFKSDISVYDVASEEFNSLVSNPSFDGFETWSPDGKTILYGSSLSDTTSNYYTNDQYFLINVDGTGNKEVAKDYDENIYGLEWNDEGIFGIAWQKTKRQLVSINPKNGKVESILAQPERIYQFSFSKDGKYLTYTAEDAQNLREIYKSEFPIKNTQKVTNYNTQIANWNVSDSEMISWKSKDGATIEGVLHKPQDYDASKKYPLLVIIHGGPTGISIPSPVYTYVYPMNQWLNKGALVLMPNYRGSAGYGADFRALNVKNLGVGDAWDVESGVEYLIKEGKVDANKVASMGWSQGGYISAFLTTNSDKFQAISVGAGISNWMTYYVNTDIHPFTRQYLKATPWSDKEIYEKTSPMTNINNAKTPTLIQHGEFDRRVPPANAYELFQGLQDVGVEAKLVIYKGFGHGITKPKERLAAVWHNWQWFAKYLWEEDVEIPE